MCCHNSENLSQEMETNRPWNWTLIVPETIKMMMVRPLMTNFKMIVRADCIISTCNPFSLSIKVLAPWLLGVKWRSQPLDRVHPTPTFPQLPASNIKQTFISTNVASLLAFEWQATRLGFPPKNKQTNKQTNKQKTPIDQLAKNWERVSNQRISGSVSVIRAPCQSDIM